MRLRPRGLGVAAPWSWRQPSGRPSRSLGPAEPGERLRSVFVDATDEAGLDWGIRKLALGGANLVETMGGGGGFVDYDRDGWLDIYLVSYSTETQDATGAPVGDALYRNNRDGTFTDVTARGRHRGTPSGPGSRGGGLRQRRLARSLRDRPQLQRPLPQPRATERSRT